MLNFIDNEGFETYRNITINEYGKCREAGYGGFGRFGDEALGKEVKLPADAPGGCETYRITRIGTRIHTSSGGGSNFVFARATYERG